jgi:thiol-disulfide isomerase/thioredoxin
MLTHVNLLLLLTLLCATPGAPASPASSDDPESGVELLGRPAPPWTFTRWIRGGPYKPADLKGKVVLLRWWTDGCHFCRTTLPVIDKEQSADVVVIGVYHPKPAPRKVRDADVLAFARDIGFTGPIALDEKWKTLERYWLAANPERSWTSVSFLIDRDGVIRWVHGGGEYHPSDDPAHHRCDLEFRDFEKALDAAVAAPATPVANP